MNLEETAQKVLDLAKKQGAQEVAVNVSEQRDIEVTFRERRVEKLAESASARLSLDLFVDGRYSGNSTSDVRPEALGAFIERAVKLTRALGPDPHRGLADPKWYRDQSAAELDLYDRNHGGITTDRRQTTASAAEEAALAVAGPIVSVSGSYSDQELRSVRLHSNGMSGRHKETSFWCGASVSVEDHDGRKPNDWHWVGSRRASGLPSAAGVGKKAAERALARLGQVKLPTGPRTLVVENRAARRLLWHLLRPLAGAALQQKRSFWLDKVGKKVAGDHFTLRDEPLLPGGFGSRRYDGDGISAKPRTLFDKGVLKGYLIDVYYARKLGVEPTGGSTSNLVFGLGEKNQKEILAAVKEGLFVTSFQGGNSDTTRGDFSHGIFGFAIRDGQLAEPIGEMNIAGNHTDLWQRLVMVGNDPYPFGSWLTPTLVFADVAVSGS